MHLSRGDIPRCSVYRSSYKLLIAGISVQLFPSQLAELVHVFQSVTQQWNDARDRTKPEANQDTTIPRSSTHPHMPQLQRSKVRVYLQGRTTEKPAT